MKRYLPLPGETEQAFIERMRSSLLPNLPTNVLSQWLYRHREHALYSSLGYENLLFEEHPEEWYTEDVPLETCGAFEAIQSYAAWYDQHVETMNYEWLCKYMTEHGTWPEPIIMLDNRDGIRLEAEAGSEAGRPYHLLEGHRRLGFFLALKRRHALAATHKVWVAVLRSPEV